MLVTNNLKLDSGAYLLFTVYYEAWKPFGPPPDAAMYLNQYEKEIDAIGRILGSLGLALPAKNLLGWKPSNHLIELIAKQHRPRLRSKKYEPSFQDQDAFGTIIDYARVDNDPHLLGYVKSLLGVLGLASHAENGDVVPTDQLRQLAARRREEERNRRPM
jgi:hypothetical protein